MIKYIALPTWLLIQLLIGSTPDHPYRKAFPTLHSWTHDSLPVLRFFDAALWILLVSFIVHSVALFV